MVSSNLLAVMCDQATENSVAVQTFKAVYPDFLHFDVSLTLLIMWKTNWHNLSSYSPKACLLWRACIYWSGDVVF